MYFDPKAMGKRISKLREQMGYNQEEYSQAINISRSSLAKIETGIRTPSIEVLMEISEFSGVSTDYLLKGNLLQSCDRKAGLDAVISFLAELKEEM